MELKKHNT